MMVCSGQAPTGPAAWIRTVVMTRHRSRSLPLLLFAVAVLAASATPALAQLQVKLELNRNRYVAYEPIHASVTITNRAGKDVVLGSINGPSWLSFNVGRVGGDTILPHHGALQFKPHVLGRGETIRETVSLGRHYPLGIMGNYTVRANVYFAEFGQHLISNVRTFDVTDGTRLWRDKIGVNKPDEPTSYRELSLLSFQEDDKMSLYVRIQEDRTSRVLATYSIGRLVLQQDPQATMDSEDNLHAFFLTGPRLYRHVVIDPDGYKLSETVYESKTNSIPELRITSSGEVRVSGGQTYDPHRPQERREVIRRLSDRPPDTPDEDVPD